jgi:hypothetical protein
MRSWGFWHGRAPDNGLRVGALGQNIQQVGGCHKIKARESDALGLQVVLRFTSVGMAFP